MNLNLQHARNFARRNLSVQTCLVLSSAVTSVCSGHFGGFHSLVNSRPPPADLLTPSFPKRRCTSAYTGPRVTFKPVVCHEANALLPHKCLSSASVQGACLSERRLCRTGFGTVGVPAHRNTECINPRPEPEREVAHKKCQKFPLCWRHVRLHPVQ